MLAVLTLRAQAPPPVGESENLRQNKMLVGAATFGGNFVPEVDLEDFFTNEQLVKYKDLFEITVGRSNGYLSEQMIPELLQRVKGRAPDTDISLYLAEYPVDLAVGLDFSSFLDLLVKVNKLKVRADLIDYKKYLNQGKIAQFRGLFTQVSGGAEGLNPEQLAG